MTAPQPYRLIGGPGSPYSMKLRAVMRYRRLPHHWVVPVGYINQGGELAKTGKTTIPVLQLPEDGSYWADSTPLVHLLEQRHPDERSLLPVDPADAFLSQLIDDFADEFLVGVLFSYRWGNPADLEFCPRRQLAGWLGAMPTEAFEKMVPMFRGRQVQKWGNGDYGTPSITGPLFEKVYFELLDTLEQLVTQSRFLFGSRPSLGEIGLFGQLSQLAIDSTASNLMKQRAPRVFQWVQDLDDASGVDGEWRTLQEQAPAALARMVQLVAAVFLPVAQAHIDAMLKKQPRVLTSSLGLPYEGIANAYTARCLLQLKTQFGRLEPSAQARVTDLIANPAIAELLQILPGEAAHVSPIAPV